MAGKLNRWGYARLIKENLEWLDKQPRTLERDHIREIVLWSVKQLYGVPYEEILAGDGIESREADPRTRPSRR